MKILIVGLGNPILGDDGIGWCTAEYISNLLNQTPSPLRINSLQVNVEVKCLSVGGLSLMEQLVGYDYAVIIDAVNIPGSDPGSVITIALDDLEQFPSGHITSSHDTSLQNALSVGKILKAHLPEKIDIVGIKAEAVYEFSEALSAEINKAIPVAAQEVLNLINKFAE